jgi:hypothetical protein
MGLEIKFHIYLSLEINEGVWSVSHHNNFNQEKNFCVNTRQEAGVVIIRSH